MKNMTLEEFRTDVLTAMKNKPKEWRDGQFVFNYIDEKYRVARYVQFIEDVDCFYNDNGIDRAIAIGIGDITCFSSWKKAEEWVKDTISRDELAGNPKYEEWNEDVKMLFVDDIVKKAKTYAQREYNKGCECRFGYTIVQPKIFQ
jgi:capsid portal protein